MRNATHSLVLLACLAGFVQAAPTMSNKDFNDLKKEAQKAAARGANSEVASRLRELARDDSDRAIAFISDLAVRIPDMAVYEAARDAIAGMETPEAVDALVDKVGKDRNPMVRILLVDAIAERTCDRSAAGIAAALGDRTEEVLRAAIGAAKKRKAIQAVDALIDLVAKHESGRDAEGLLINSAREALTHITGEAFAKAADWRNFWEPRKASFRPRTGGEAPRVAGGTGERARPRFFGSEIRSNRIAFVIDVSGSMEAADPPPRGVEVAPGESRVRMERAKQQLQAVIDALPDDCRFTMLAYSGILYQSGAGVTLPQGTPTDGPLPWTLGGFEWLKAFKPRIVQANSRTKAEAKEWISTLKANGSTFTLNALKACFELEGIDTIILLSDGMPTEVNRSTNAGLSTDEILKEIQALNRFRRLRIDTFGFEAGDDSGGGAGGGSRAGGRRAGGGGLGKFMLDLAAQNGGSYTQIQ